MDESNGHEIAALAAALLYQTRNGMATGNGVQSNGVDASSERTTWWMKRRN